MAILVITRWVIEPLPGHWTCVPGPVGNDVDHDATWEASGEPRWEARKGTAGMIRMNRGWKYVAVTEVWKVYLFTELGKNHFLKWENCVYDVDMWYPVDILWPMMLRPLNFDD